MRISHIGAVLLCLVAGAFAAGDYLVRVDPGPNLDARSIAEAGGAILNRFDEWYLVRASDATVERLAGTASLLVLDSNPATGRYVYAYPDARLDQDRLGRCGTILTRGRTGLLLRTDEQGIEALNRLPVELCAISMRPMYLEETPNSKSQIPNNRTVSDSLIWTLVNRVSQDSLAARLRRMVAFRTRYAPTESCRSACAWMRSELAAYGCDSTYLDTFVSGYAPNVVGVRTGTVNPRRIFVVTGHIDNTSETPQTFAPGSDDNASGIGLALEAARVFADMDFENTVWFVGFSAEEQGLVGSDSFVHACRQRGDSIIAAFHSDMISYGRDDSLCVVHTTALPQTESLAQFFLAQADTFTSLQVKDTVVNEARSDHYSFWKYGYLAIRGRFHDETPMYHTTGDTIGPFHYVNCGTNNLPLYTEMVKAAVATLAKWAGATPRTALEAGRSSVVARLRVVIRPNPCRNSATVSFPSPVPASSSVSLFDASGRVICSYPIRAQSFAIRTSRLAPGVYFARLGDGGATCRFVRAE